MRSRPASSTVCARRYVQAAAFQQGYRNTFGYPLTYNISGTLHTHVLGWKADLDIGGRSNSVNIHTMRVRPTETAAPRAGAWPHTQRSPRSKHEHAHRMSECVLPPPPTQIGTADDGAGGKIFINQYDAKLAENENEASYATTMTSPKIPVVVNEGVRNSYGSMRGYKVQLNRPLLNLAPESDERNKGLGELRWLAVVLRLHCGCTARLARAHAHTQRAEPRSTCRAGFMKYSFAATKHKDEEQHSSSIYAQARLSNPSTSLTDYVDGEGLRNTDVVVWVNSGLYHVPVSEDAPVTTTTGNMLSFSLIPFNWANESPATDMADMVQIEKSNNVQPAAKTAAGRCRPSFTNVRFLTNGFEQA